MKGKSMKAYAKPKIVSYEKSARANYIGFDPCSCEHTGSQSIPKCTNSGAKA